MSVPPTRRIGGLDVMRMRGDDLIALLRRRRDEGQPTELMFANTNFVMGCHALAPALHGPETLIANDGIGLDLASRMLHGERFAENLNGTDFTPRFLRSLDRPTRLFLLGARGPVVEAAAAAWRSLPNVEVVGAVDGYDGIADDDALMYRVHDARPDILLVAIGDPRQAEWIIGHRGRHGVLLVVAVGALFDFVAGRVKRAPIWVRRLRLEWLYRLAQEPRRLLKRYSIDLVRFFAHCLRTHRMERALQGTVVRTP